MSDTRDDGTGPEEPADIKPVSILDEMKRSYLDYAMSVIVSRALPDVRDGLKPVHRRILYAMHELELHARPALQQVVAHRRRHDGQVPSARRSRDLRRARPHGAGLLDARAADRRAGQFRLGRRRSARGLALHRGEARPLALALLEDLDKDTVDFKPNYDEKEEEPVVLPARFPNLLVNGAGGIAVGMATNIPPHNLGETIDALLAMMEKPDITLDELMEHMPGPDFPTGGAILGRAGIRSAYATGRGSIIMRAKVAVEEMRKQGPRGADRSRDPLPGQQVDADREDRRTRAREAHRRHFRPARRIRPRRHAHRHRAQARRGRRRRAQPALALHRDAVELRLPT